MTQIIKSITEWRALRNNVAFQNKSIGFVPTMGALHAGHQSLLKRCRAENEIAVLSIFINPTQFDDPNDLKKYPKTLDADLQIAQTENIDYLFLPNADEMYSDRYRYKITENDFSKSLCGAFRSGHFDGVLTVVLKLLNLVKPQRAYFGEKDYQQYLLVKEMVRSLFLNIEIIACPIIRDKDGLALSSRNKHLSPNERKLAAEFPKLLTSDLSVDKIQQQLSLLGFLVDYIEEKNGRRFGAVHVGNTRLIDNIEK